MPLEKDPKGGGSEADGSLSRTYCSICYQDGVFVHQGVTAEAFQAQCVEALADLSILIGQLAAADGDDFDGDAFLAAKIAEVEMRIEQSQRFLETLRTTRQALEDAPKGET